MKIQMSDKTKELFLALEKVKADLKPLKKDSKNPFYKSKYADLNQHLELVEPILEEHGLILLQPMSATDIANYVNTTVIHVESGQWISSSLMITKLTDPQKLLAAITYFRRGSINALFALKSEDDDGNTASGKGKKSKKNKTKKYYDDLDDDL